MNSPNSLIETLYRHGIGYDTIARFPEAFTNVANFPPHNIEKLSESNYRLTIAVAGFNKEEIKIQLHKETLTIYGTKQPPNGNDHPVPTKGPSFTPYEAPQMLYRGIALRDFTREFKIGEHVQVISAQLNDGLLVVELERQIPEELLPRHIELK